MDSPIPQNDKERVLKFFEIFTENDMSKLLKTHTGFLPESTIRDISKKLAEYFGRTPYIFKDPKLKMLQSNLLRSWFRYSRLVLSYRHKLNSMTAKDKTSLRRSSVDTEEEKEFKQLLRGTTNEILKDFDFLTDSAKEFIDKDESINDGVAIKIETDKKIDEDAPIEIGWEKIGNLTREHNGESLKYPINGARKKMVESLINYRVSGFEYMPTTNLKLETDKVENRNVRSEIGKINAEARKLLKLKMPLIENRKNSGYRINKNIKIKFSD